MVAVPENKLKAVVCMRTNTWFDKKDKGFIDGYTNGFAVFVRLHDGRAGLLPVEYLTIVSDHNF